MGTMRGVGQARIYSLKASPRPMETRTLQRVSEVSRCSARGWAWLRSSFSLKSGFHVLAGFSFFVFLSMPLFSPPSLLGIPLPVSFRHSCLFAFSHMLEAHWPSLGADGGSGIWWGFLSSPSPAMAHKGPPGPPPAICASPWADCLPDIRRTSH